MGVEVRGMGDTAGGRWGDGVSRGGWKMGWKIKVKDSHTALRYKLLLLTSTCGLVTA